MSFIVLFALLGLFLAEFREGVWRRYTSEDVARWQAETEACEVPSPVLATAPVPLPAATFSRPDEPVKPVLRTRPQAVREAA
ncbi:MAG TPA: hypothetical protein VF629_17370 [Hymenobacter sp.]|jgi:hypothetical protein|uniref:hypothetical protein n=1 Tax=Hymenobacter sp. TaxID=1898978 RepID=UPI002ED7AB38